MIKKINIKNFKSIENIDFELGSRINVIIGANGSGKTNVLEAIIMGAAARADKLDYEFLGNRLRMTTPEFMRNAFRENKEKEIELKFETNKKEINYKLINDKNDYRKWINAEKENYKLETIGIFKKIFLDKKSINEFDLDLDVKEFFEKINSVLPDDKEANKVLSEMFPLLAGQLIDKEFSDRELTDFLIYTPELSYLKKFEEPAQILPIGTKGEGLFYELKKLLSNKKKSKQINFN